MKLYTVFPEMILKFFQGAAVFPYLARRNFFLQGICRQQPAHLPDIPFNGVQAIAAVRQLRCTDVFAGRE